MFQHHHHISAQCVERRFTGLRPDHFDSAVQHPCQGKAHLLQCPGSRGHRQTSPGRLNRARQLDSIRHAALSSTGDQQTPLASTSCTPYLSQIRLDEILAGFKNRRQTAARVRPSTHKVGIAEHLKLVMRTEVQHLLPSMAHIERSSQEDRRLVFPVCGCDHHLLFECERADRCTLCVAQ